MYYIIETNYVGPNAAQHVDADTIEITTVPAVSNSTGQVRLNGWCGTTNDWSVHAHGSYATLSDAMSAIEDLFNEVRDCNPNGDPFLSDDPTVVHVYRPGAYAPMGIQETGEWLSSGFSESILVQTTDEQISALLHDWEAEANHQGYTLHRRAIDLAHDYRSLLNGDRAEPI